jgi:uncharacterized protein (TIGR02145 family)
MKKHLLLLLIAIFYFFGLNAQIPTDGLVAYYPFNGNANDECGNGNNGTVNGVTLAADRFGNENSAYSFDGVNDYIKVPYDTCLNPASITVALWIKKGTLNRAQSECFFDYNGAGTDPPYDPFHMWFHADSNYVKIDLSGDDDSKTIQLAGETEIDSSNWHHFSVTFMQATGEAVLYVNGKLHDSSSLQMSLSYNNLGIILGSEQLADGNPNPQWHFKGLLDDIRIYDHALTDEEIKSLYHENGYACVTDIDGNVYNTVKIGNRVWMKENLKTTHYNNGDLIPNVAGQNSSTGERCYYNNDSATYAGTYGMLYNWYAVNDNRKLCPTGWHVPTDTEWTILTNYLGGTSVAGGKLKEMGTTHWTSPNTGANNESGFTALPAGDCDINGVFWDIANNAYIWSSTENISTNAWIRELGYNHTEVYRNAYNKGDEISVRCLKDEEVVNDIDGNSYNTVKIGNQIWMKENLKTTHYNNGDPIPNVSNNGEWNSLTTGARCYYNNDSAANTGTYGGMYNFFAVEDNRQLCPTGWHVPTDSEWTILTDYLGGESIAGVKLKEAGTAHWTSPNTDATNESGFTGLPGGYRNWLGSFYDIGGNGTWRTSTEISSDLAWARSIYYNSSNVSRGDNYKKGGFSVRCIKNEEVVTDIDGNSYNTVKIGNQVWMKENLKTTHYADGTPLVDGTGAGDISGDYTTKYWFAYGDNLANKNTYGLLYTWAAAMNGAANSDENPSGIQGICPDGWHLPSDNEWTELSDYLGGSGVAGGKLKESGYLHWNSPNTVADNSSGFTALPAGYRIHNGYFENLFYGAYFWSSTESSSYLAWDRGLYYKNSEFGRYSVDTKSYGFSVRCLKDAVEYYSLTIQNANVNENDTVEIHITTGDLTIEDDIISYQFDIDYDTEVLEYTENTIIGTLAEGGTVMVNTGTSGKLSVGYMGTDAIVCAGDILILKFKGLKVDTTILTMTNAYLNDSMVNNITNGTVIVLDITPPTAGITFNDNDIRCADTLLITATFHEPMNEVNPVKLTLSGAANLSAVDMTRQSETVYTYTYLIPKANGVDTVTLSGGTDMSGNEVVSTPTSGSTFTIIPIRYGDVDDNGKILAYDAALTLRYSIGLDPLPDIDPISWENWRDTTANVDGVGGVTANDVAEILKYSIGLITQFPAESGMKSGYESDADADITITIENGCVIFKSYGELFGLNVFVNDNKEYLGTPLFLNESLLTATNITSIKYAIGMCTATALAEGTELMKIPFTVTSTKSITFDMIVNTLEKQVIVDLVTGMVEVKDKALTIYPNPANNKIFINVKSQDAKIAIYDIHGRLVIEKMIKDNQVDISKLVGGVYLIKVYERNTVVSGLFVKE